MAESALATEPAITVRDLTFSYDGVPVLVDVDLEVRQRDLVCIVGPNGGGKSTLLKLMLGLLRPDRGRVRVFGRAPAAVRGRIGYMPQHTDHDPQFPVTVLDVVLMGRLERHFGGPYDAADRRAALSALEEVDMAELAERPLDALSGGQRQRVLIARALACEPEILMLDEPTANIDAVVEHRLHEILERLNRRMTVLMATHDLGFVCEVVKTVVCVNRRVAVHPTSELTGDVIQEFYEGEVRAVRHDRNVSGGGSDE